MAYYNCVNGTTQALLVMCTPFTCGPTARCGRREYPGLRKPLRFRRNSIGIYGLALLLTRNTLKRSIRSTGADGGITAPARLVTWLATWLNLPSACST